MNATASSIQETRIRDVWPSVARSPAIAGLGKSLTYTIVLAPLAWLIMSSVYFLKLMPIVGVRYRLTDKRISIAKGWGCAPQQEVALADIDDVKLDPASIDNFFRSADLQVFSNGRLAMTLVAVPDAESFRRAILDTRNAWAPGKVKTLPFISAAASK